MVQFFVSCKFKKAAIQIFKVWLIQSVMPNSIMPNLRNTFMIAFNDLRFYEQQQQIDSYKQRKYTKSFQSQSILYSTYLNMIFKNDKSV